METAKKALEMVKKGHATILWGKIVVRVGDKFIIGETIRMRDDGVSIDEAAEILSRKE